MIGRLENYVNMLLKILSVSRRYSFVAYKPQINAIVVWYRPNILETPDDHGYLYFLKEGGILADIGHNSFCMIEK